MRDAPLVLAVLALVHLLGVTPARAASFDATVEASQEAASGSSNSSDVDQETVPTSPASASLVFTGSSSAFGLPARTGTTTASGSAVSRFDADGLELAVVARSKTSGTTDGLGPFDYRSTANASAGFLDAISITGGTPGATGYIHATFTLDGALTSTAVSGSNTSRADLFVLVADSVGGFFTLSLSSLNGSPVAVPPAIEYYLKYKFDEEAPFSASMHTHTFGFLASSALNVTQVADFANTLRFVQAEVLDADFQPVLGGRIVSASGLPYPLGPLDHIVLTPQSATVAAGTGQTYVVEGFDTNGNSLGNLAAQATLSISPDGSCIGATCTATTAGPHTVTADVQGKTDTASLTVDPGPLHHLALSPADAAIVAGDSQAYTAEGLDAFGNSLGDVTGATTFSIAPNGSCLGAVCSATIAGAHTVTGNDGDKTGATGLTVNPGPLDHITISPASVTTTAGGSQTYAAHGFDAFENPLGDVTGGTTFSIAPDGSCLGATCTASIVGPHTVTGDHGGLTAAASFTVIPGPPRPDLVITAVGNAPATIRFFGRISVQDTVKNQGSAPSNLALTRYYISADQARGAGDRLLLGVRLVGPMAPGQSSSGGATLFVFGAPAGTYYLLACADDRNTSTEGDETNNCLASATQIVVQ